MCRLRRPTAARSTLFALLTLGLLVTAAACTAEEASAPQPDQVTTTFDRTVQRPIIKIGVTGWATARLNVAVAETLIERRLGYPVEAVETVDLRSMFSDLERGDELHAVLEIWPNSLEQRERAYLDQNRVASLGELGVTGRIGWYMPASAASELGVETWEDLRDPTVVASLAPGPTPEVGRGRFLGISPSSSPFDEELMVELGLPYDVEFSGSESGTGGEVEAAVAAGKPILIHWWTPTELAVKADLVQIPLPAWTEDCQADRDVGLPAPCGYRPERLQKVGWPDLVLLAPEVDRFLRAFSLTNNDHDQMLASLAEGRTISQAADEWIEQNGDVWQPWLEPAG